MSWGELHFKLLESLAPPSILVDAEHDILHLSPSAGRLSCSSPAASRAATCCKAVHPSLRVELRAALYQAAQTRSSTQVEVGPVELEGRAMSKCRSVSRRPTKSAKTCSWSCSDARRTGSGRPGRVGHGPARCRPTRWRASSTANWSALKAHLRDTVEQYEASTEELKASNEELQAMNEELRSATEELETSREELQSINEELTTVNQELKSKVDELAHANSDIHNLMDATEIATVFLDRELRISRYTPSAVHAVEFDPHRCGPDAGGSRAAVRLSAAQHRRATGARSNWCRSNAKWVFRDGKWFLSRLLPYRTMETTISRVSWCSFIDITRAETDRQKHFAAARSACDMVVENAREYAIFSTDLERRVTIWNSGAQRLLGYEAQRGAGAARPTSSSPTKTGRPARPSRKWRRRWPRAGPSDDRMHQRKDGSRFWASGALMLMRDAQGQAVGFVKILRDQTAARETQQALERSQAELLRALAENETRAPGIAGRRHRQGPFPGGAVARAAQSAGLDRQRRRRCC